MDLIWQVADIHDIKGRVIDVAAKEFGTATALVVIIEPENGQKTEILLSDLAIHLLEERLAGLRGKTVIIKGRPKMGEPFIEEIG